MSVGWVECTPDIDFGIVTTPRDHKEAHTECGKGEDRLRARRRFAQAVHVVHRSRVIDCMCECIMEHGRHPSRGTIASGAGLGLHGQPSVLTHLPPSVAEGGKGCESWLLLIKWNQLLPPPPPSHTICEPVLLLMRWDLVLL